jgi:serine/threonine protein kinase
MELPSNTTLQAGKYKIIRKIGQGGFGIAYKANHVPLNRTVCIKEFFYSDFCERAKNSLEMSIISSSKDKIKLVDTFKTKFIKEAKRLATFHHTNIVQVTDVFEENNTAYFVMEYLEGDSLEELIRRDGAVSERKAKEIILPIIDGLDVVHANGLLHLDIKPANIMLRKDQTPVLIDFGISKYMDTGIGNQNTTTTAPIGYSEGYSPIEQSSFGSNVANFTQATDIYSLCATMYKMVTGVTPPIPNQIIIHGLKSPKEIKTDISENFNVAILKGLSIKITDRHQTCFYLKNAIGQIDKNKLIKYEHISEFRDGLALMFDSSNGKWGLIDINGVEISPCKYDVIDNFYDDLAMVQIRNKYGYIDKNGKEVIPLKFDDGLSFNEGLAIVKLNCKWGCIDKTGNTIITLRYEELFWFCEGLAAVKFNGKYGYIDKNGKEVIPLKFGDGLSFNEGLAAVELNGKWGLIDKNGEIVIPLKYNRLRYYEGLAAVKMNEKWGYIDKYGNKVIACRYDSLLKFNDNLAAVKSNGKWGFIDKQGQYAVNVIYDDVKNFNEGLAAVELDKKWGFIDKNGNRIIPFKYDFAGEFENGFARVKSERKWGCIDKNERVVIPIEYDSIRNFRCGLAAVKLNGKWGFIDKDGYVVIPFKYDFVMNFVDGIVPVILNDRTIHLDKEGKEVTPFWYHKMIKRKYWCYIDNTGKVVLT